MKKYRLFLLITLILLPMSCVYADPTIPVLISKQSAGGVTYGISLKILALMSVLAVLPALLMTMSAFTRIIIVLAIARQAIGVPNIPNNQILIGLSLMMTLFVMSPVINKINETSVQPYLAGQMDEQIAFNNAGVLVKSFMMKQTRKADLNLFVKISKTQVKNNDYSLLILMPAFLTSELKTAFEIGFLIFLPFLIIDIVVASILMSMGMMMLSPMVISLPFKILFFVLVDGWSLIVTSLITSFRI